MLRCIMCDALNPMYIPDDVVDNYGLNSCGSGGFEMECPRDRTPSQTTAAPLAPATSSLDHRIPLVYG